MLVWTELQKSKKIPTLRINWEGFIKIVAGALSLRSSLNIPKKTIIN